MEAAEAIMFGKWSEKYFKEAPLAESTRAMRKSVYDRNLAAEFGRLKLEEITPSRLLMRCGKIKERGAAAPAVQARDIVLQVYRFVQARGLKVANPAEDIRPSAIVDCINPSEFLNPKEDNRTSAKTVARQPKPISTINSAWGLPAAREEYASTSSSVASKLQGCVRGGQRGRIPVARLRYRGKFWIELAKALLCKTSRGVFKPFSGPHSFGRKAWTDVIITAPIGSIRRTVDARFRVYTGSTAVRFH